MLTQELRYTVTSQQLFSEEHIPTLYDRVKQEAHTVLCTGAHCLLLLKNAMFWVFGWLTD